MKTLLIIPVVIAAALAAVAGICHLSGLHPHGRDVLLTGGIAIVAAELALAPMFLIRPIDAVAIWQTALLSTVIHMLAMVALTVVILFGKVVDVRERALPYWLILGYWVSLAALAWGILRVARRLHREGTFNQKTEVKAV